MSFPVFSILCLSNPNRKTFIFYEVDNLIFDVILHILTLALLNDTFIANIKTPEDFYRLYVRFLRNSLEFDWKKEKLDISIFRQAVRINEGIRTSEIEPIRYHIYLYYLQRLGRMTGFIQILQPYCIRRGAGESAEGESIVVL